MNEHAATRPRRPMRLPGTDLAEPCARGILGALGAAGGPTQLQLDLLRALTRALGAPIDIDALTPMDATELAAAVRDPLVRHELIDLLVALELVVHPLPVELQERVAAYAHTLGVHEAMLDAARDVARSHVGRLHADLLRHSWYTEQTMHEVHHGLALELARSKASYFGAPPDRAVADRWHALARLPEGSWGRRVAEFYERHQFPMPGERHGIYEIGAMHDWVHVLADYGTDPEGEIDVFTFIAGTMRDPHGFVLFITTLCLFQNAAIRHVGGKKVLIARADALGDPGAADRWADAFWRSSRCIEDVMGGIDHFALASTSLDELRSRWAIPAKRVAGPGAFD